MDQPPLDPRRTESLRERKKAQTRDALFAAGMRLFAARGFAAVTVAEISAEADVAPRTFHRYFPDKVELLFAGDDDLRESMITAFDQTAVDADPVVVIRAVFAAVAKRLGDQHPELVIRERLISETPALRDRDLAKRARLEELVAERLAVRFGVTVDDLRPRWWAGVAFATFAAGYRAWLTQGGDLGAHLESALELLEHGVR
ncbi:acyl-CoA-like ligand-binding transcription factor [Agromyces albus]|jgi:AcrR family transcriptional regulator|uniref:acyl-CoA-like ligand-binding transcription factor n=1 Tax=Agromyces albus TaxID=205332 RepID=UPI0027D8C35A|nr:TetR family transcriptional regulator [Agromyces albus]